MNELFFGVKREKNRKRDRKSPKKRKRSPKRVVKMCNSKLSLTKLRKLAVANGIDIYSRIRPSINIKTGLPKKPKLVGCNTLMKRLKEEGLDHLYKVRPVHLNNHDDYHVEDNQVEDHHYDEHPELFLEQPVNKNMPVLMVDPACASEFDKISGGQPWLARQYKGYAVGSGPCSKRDMVLREGDNDDDEDNLPDYSDVAGFDMSYGIRHRSGARPKKTQKHMGTIEVKGRKHHVFKGKEGGLYYLKGKTGNKIYIDKTRLKKK